MNKLGTGKMTEEEMRDLECPRPRSLKELNVFLTKLEKENNDYGKAVYCMSLGASAAYYYMAHVVRASGFQASCADMNILTRTRKMERWCIVDYSILLYPQYCNDEYFPVMDKMFVELAPWLAKKAKELLRESPDGHKDVVKHWKMLINNGKKYKEAE